MAQCGAAFEITRWAEATVPAIKPVGKVCGDA
jgi:hypothetical protein